MDHHASQSGDSPWRGGRWLLFPALLVAFFLLAGCAETGQMNDQPRYDPLEASDFFPEQQSALLPVPGTVPFASTDSPNSPAVTGLTEDGEPVQGWPVEVNQEMVQLGQERYNIFCIPCHGPTGEGNGKVTGFGFPKPASLLAENARSLSNGEIFEIIQNGRGNMYPYGYRVKPDERWAVIAYIRALQLKNGAVNLQDLTPGEIDQIGSQQ